MTFNDKQVAQLLRPIARQRVLQDAKGHAHVSQQDITAHLIRVFGFGNFDTEVVDVQCVFERPTVSISKGKEAPDPNRFDVCYRALVRLIVRDAAGSTVCHYEDGSTHTAQNQPLGDAHDLAYKSALSLAKKRCAINLGDQFGLSLYNKGQMSALVKGTLVNADRDAGDQHADDVQEGVEQQVSLGNDEIDNEPVHADPAPFEAKIAACTTPAELAGVGRELAAADLAAVDRDRLRGEYEQRSRELRGAA